MIELSVYAIVLIVVTIGLGIIILSAFLKSRRFNHYLSALLFALIPLMGVHYLYESYDYYSAKSQTVLITQQAGNSYQLSFTANTAKTYQVSLNFNKANSDFKKALKKITWTINGKTVSQDQPYVASFTHGSNLYGSYVGAGNEGLYLSEKIKLKKGDSIDVNITFAADLATLEKYHTEVQIYPVNWEEYIGLSILFYMYLGFTLTLLMLLLVLQLHARSLPKVPHRV